MEKRGWPWRGVFEPDEGGQYLRELVLQECWGRVRERGGGEEGEKGGAEEGKDVVVGGGGEGGVGEAYDVVEGLETPELDGDEGGAEEAIKAEAEEGGWMAGFEAVAELDGLGDDGRVGAAAGGVVDEHDCALQVVHGEYMGEFSPAKRRGQRGEEGRNPRIMQGAERESLAAVQ